MLALMAWPRAWTTGVSSDGSRCADNSPNNLIVLCAKHHKVVECATADMLSLGLGYEVVAQIMGARLRYRQSLTIYRLLKVANERARQIA